MRKFSGCFAFAALLMGSLTACTSMQEAVNDWERRNNKPETEFPKTIGEWFNWDPKNEGPKPGEKAPASGSSETPSQTATIEGPAKRVEQGSLGNSHVEEGVNRVIDEMNREHAEASNSVASRTADLDGLWVGVAHCPGTKRFVSLRLERQPDDRYKGYYKFGTRDYSLGTIDPGVSTVLFRISMQHKVINGVGRYTTLESVQSLKPGAAAIPVYITRFDDHRMVLRNASARLGCQRTDLVRNPPIQGLGGLYSAARTYFQVCQGVFKSWFRSRDQFEETARDISRNPPYASWFDEYDPKLASKVRIMRDDVFSDHFGVSISSMSAEQKKELLIQLGQCSVYNFLASDFTPSAKELAPPLRFSQEIRQRLNSASGAKNLAFNFDIGSEYRNQAEAVERDLEQVLAALGDEATTTEEGDEALAKVEQAQKDRELLNYVRPVYARYFVRSVENRAEVLRAAVFNSQELGMEELLKLPPADPLEQPPIDPRYQPLTSEEMGRFGAPTVESF